MFRSYNEKSCLFECRLQFARNASGGCIPWEYPIPTDLKHRPEICYNSDIWTYFKRSSGPKIPVPPPPPFPPRSQNLPPTGPQGEGQKNVLSEFELAMNSPEALAGCDCLPNCEEIVYETQVQIVTHSGRKRIANQKYVINNVILKSFPGTNSSLNGCARQLRTFHV